MKQNDFRLKRYRHEFPDMRNDSSIELEPTTNEHHPTISFLRRYTLLGTKGWEWIVPYRRLEVRGLLAFCLYRNSDN